MANRMTGRNKPTSQKYFMIPRGIVPDSRIWDLIGSLNNTTCYQCAMFQFNMPNDLRLFYFISDLLDMTTVAIVILT